VLGLLLIGATVGVSVDEVRDVEPAVTDRIVETLARHISAHSGRAVVRDTMLWSSCTRDDRCIDAVRSRTKTDDIAFVQIFGGVRRVRVRVDHIEGNGRLRSARATLPLGEDFGPPLLEVVRRTFDPGVAPPPPPPPVVTAPPPERTTWPIWLAAGVTVAASGAAIGFGVSANSASSELNGRITRPAEYDALSDRAGTHGTISNVAWISAAVAAGATLTLLVLELANPDVAPERVGVELGDDNRNGLGYLE
jgi:hypothetical protein